MPSPPLFTSPNILALTAANLIGFSVAVVAVILQGALRQQARGHDPKTYNARLAWLRAGVYFGAGLCLSWLTGVLDAVLQRPLFTAEQLADPAWVTFTLVCIGIEVLGYWVIWPRGTRTYGRPLHWPTVLGFGLVWGVCEAQLLLSLWAIVEKFVTARWLVVGLAFLIIAAFIGLWHTLYWDIYVAPDHNIPEWNLKKVLFAHTPNIICTLIYLALYGNAGMFVIFQTIALVGSTLFMRFPPLTSSA
jgi:hypothetical protein